jgi:two-component system, NarL family, response regulator DevR
MSTTISPDPTSDLTSDPPSRTAPALRVVVVESNEWLRSRLCQLLQTEPGFQLAGVAAGTEEALSMAEREELDIVVVGHRPPGASAFALCRELKRKPSPPAVVICSAYPDGALAACCEVAGADALIGMHDCGAELPGVFDRVARGVRFLPPVTPAVGAVLKDRLDPAEYAVFGLLLAGFPAADVASALRISEAELESLQAALLGKLGALPAAPGARR